MSNMHLFTVQIDIGMTATSVFSGPLRYGVPVLGGVAGTSVGDPSRRLSVVSLEWPEQFSVSNERVERELDIAARADVDLRRDGKPPIFGLTEPGGDPPDLIATIGTEKRGVEVTQLVVSDRVQAAMAFQEVRAAVAGAYPRRFRALRGHVAYVSVQAKHAPIAGRDVVEALAGYTPSDVQYEDIPENLSGYPVGKGAGFSITAAKFPQQPNSLFYNAMGFELVLCNTTHIDEAFAWNEVLRRVTGNHDKPGVHDLLISAGAPIATGWAFPSDGVIGALALGVARSSPITTQNIERVFIHLWAWRAVFELRPGEPGFVQLCGDRSFLDAVPPDTPPEIGVTSD